MNKKNLTLLGALATLIAELYAISSQLTELQLKIGEKISIYEKIYNEVKAEK